MIIGIDIGYSYTKNSEGNIFKSAYKGGKAVLGGIPIEISGKSYTIGIGNTIADENKISSNTNELCLLAALGMTSHNNFYVVTGLPVGQFRKQSSELKKQLLTHTCIRFKLNDTEKTISILKAEVFPQGVGALYSQSVYQDVIILDIGGRTVDIAYIEYIEGKYQLTKSITLYSGMERLYADIMTEVNSKYDMSLNNEYAEKILQGGLCVNSERQDLSFLSPVLKSFVSEIETEIIRDYPYKTTEIYLCGGGAKILDVVLQNRFTNVKVFDNPQFANANGFKALGEMLWR